MTIQLDVRAYVEGNRDVLPYSSFTIGDHPNRRLVVAFGTIDTDASSCVVTGMTWNGVALTKFAQVDSTGTQDAHAYWWYLDNPDTGNHTLAWTLSSVNFMSACISILSLYNVDLATSPRDAGTAAGNTAVFTTVATSVSGDYVTGVLSLNGGDVAITVTAPATEILEEAFTGSFSLNHDLADGTATGATFTMQWTASIGNRGAALSVAMRPRDSYPTVTVRSHDEDLVVAFVTADAPVDIVANSPHTPLTDETSATNTTMGGESTGAKPTVTVGWTMPMSNWVALAVSLKPAVSWTELTSVLQEPPPTWERGLPGADIQDLVADTGRLTFSLDVSKWSPLDWTIADSDFGMPIKAETNGQRMFVGTIADERPSAGEYDFPTIEIEAHDWMGYLAEQELGIQAVGTNQDVGDVLSQTLESFRVQPDAFDFDDGIETFAATFNTDSPQSTMASFFQKMARNEMGRIYLDRQGVLRFENRDTRPLTTTPAFTLNGIMSSLEVVYERHDISNIIQVRTYPTKIDTAATTIIYSLASGNIPNIPLIRAGETLTLTCPYTDPSTGMHISAIDVVEPVTFEFGTLQNFVSNNLHSFIAQDNDIGGNAAIVRLTNTGTKDGYLNDLQILGRGIYVYNPFTTEARNQDSIDAGAGERRMVFDLEQHTDPEDGHNVAVWVLNAVGTTPVKAKRVIFLANQSSALVAAALALEISSRFTLIETATGISEDFFVQRIIYRQAGPMLWVEMLSVPASRYRAWIWDSSLWDNTVREGWAL